MSPVIASLILLSSGLAALGISSGDPLHPSLYSWAFLVIAVYGGLVALRKKNFRRALFFGGVMTALPAVFLFLWDSFFLQRGDITNTNYIYLGLSAGLAVFYIVTVVVLKSEFGDKKTSLATDSLFALGLLLVPILLGNVLVIYFWNLAVRPVYTFVPQGAIYIIESTDPINDWKEFSGSKVWKHMKQNPTYAYLTETADWLDGLIKDNDKVLGVLNGKMLIISAHMTPNGSYDFLYTMDLGSEGKVSYYMDGVNGLMHRLGYQIEKLHENGQVIHAFGDETGMLYITFSGNVMLASYTKDLLHQAIRGSEKPFFMENTSYRQVVSKTSAKGQCRVWVNYKQLLPYLRLYMADVSGTPTTLCEVLDFSGLDVSLADDHASLNGYSIVSDSGYSLLGALRNVSGSSMKADEIMPANMSFFARLGFNDFNTFYGYLIENMKQDPKEYAEMEKMKSKIEKIFKFSLEDDLLGWIGDEITLGMMPLDDHGQRQAYVAFFRAQDSTLAREKMDFVTKRIKKAVISPAKFKRTDYRGYEVNYLEMKGFFRLFFGKLFDRYEKPEFVHIGEYVVFSNDTTALNRIIDARLDGQTMKTNESFQDFAGEFSNSSNYFIYLNSQNIFPWLTTLGTSSAQIGMRRNRKFITCFPQVGFQMIAASPGYQTELYAAFESK